MVERGRRQTAYAGDPRDGVLFSKDLEENKARNDLNKVTAVKLMQGDLAEAWREGETDSPAGDAVLAVDRPRSANRPPVAGRETRSKSHRSRDLARRRGADWELSAIQQTS